MTLVLRQLFGFFIFNHLNVYFYFLFVCCGGSLVGTCEI